MVTRLNVVIVVIVVIVVRDVRMLECLSFWNLYAQNVSNIPEISYKFSWSGKPGTEATRQQPQMPRN